MLPCWSRCGIVGGDLSLGMGSLVSKDTRPIVSFSACLPADQDVTSHLHDCLPAIVLPAIVIMDEPSETISILLNAFFYELSWLWYLFTALEL